MMERELYSSVVLAAGEAKRFGSPKQLLSYNGMTLLEHAACTAIKFSPGNCFVVLGAHLNECQQVLKHLPVTQLIAERWQAGIGASIAYAASQVETEYVVFFLCDQPNITVSSLQKLTHKQQESGKGIVAAAWDQQIGPPVLFHRRFFKDLKNLNGDVGGKALFKKYPDMFATASIREAAIDIDTTDDWDQFKNSVASDNHGAA